MSNSYRVTFAPSGRTATVPAATLLSEAAHSAGLRLRTPCGGKGTCGKCRVRITSGQTDPAATRPAVIPAADWQEGWRLACQTRVISNLVVDVPADAVDAAGQRILLSTNGHHEFDLAPSVNSRQLVLSPPTREDDLADVARLEQALDLRLRFPLAILQELPGTLRNANWQVSLIHDGPDVLAVAPQAQPPLGIAFDLGTTTVVGTLYDLTTGRELDRKSTRLNSSH